MARSKAVFDLFVVARTLIRVLDQDADGRAGCLAFEHAGEDAHRIRLLALAHEVRGAGAATIHVPLQIGFGQLEPRRTAVDDAAERRPVAFAEGRDGEELADRVTGH